MRHREIIFRPIGVMHSEIAAPDRIPARPALARNLRGIAEIFPEYADRLHGLEDCSHLYVIYHEAGSKVRGDGRTGKFAAGLNGLGMSLVELILWQGNMLHLRGVDIQDGTPIIDIRPGEPGSKPIQPERDSLPWRAGESLSGLSRTCGYLA